MTSTKPLITPFDMAAFAANLMDDRKARDIVILHTDSVSTLADYFVIASVESRTQMMALANHLIKDLKGRSCEPIGQEIDQSGRWTLLDFGDVVIHLFREEDRSYYHLEGFWNHATELPREQWLRPQVRQAS